MVFIANRTHTVGTKMMKTHVNPLYPDKNSHELNHQLLGRAINCNVTDGLCARCHHK